jgi:hypothetical protein
MYDLDLVVILESEVFEAAGPASNDQNADRHSTSPSAREGHPHVIICFTRPSLQNVAVAVDLEFGDSPNTAFTRVRHGVIVDDSASMMTFDEVATEAWLALR